MKICSRALSQEPVTCRILACIALVFASAAACPAIDPGFAVEPQVIRSTNGYTVTFTVSEPTDVTVAAVEPKSGKVLRHLAFGMVGDKPASPFARGLYQSLAWDGRDDAGNPVSTGAVIRVGLGTHAEFERILRSEPQGVSSRGSVAMAVDDKGVMYNVHGHIFVANITTLISITAFDREGSYVKVIEPFRADWPKEKVSAIDWLTLADGREIPLTSGGGHRPYNGFISGIPGMHRFQALISREGQLIMVSGGGVRKPGETSAQRRLIAIGTDGSAPADKFYGPVIPAGGGDTFLAFSPDQKYVYVSGLKVKGSATPGVYRVQWSDKDAPVKVFIGGEKGKADGQFSEPRGVATASDGRIAVGDYMNDRIQVFNADGAFLKALPVPGPDTVLIHPKTGEVYVLSVRDRGTRKQFADVNWEVFVDKSIVKYKSLDDWTEVARMDLPKVERYFHDSPPILAMDLSQERLQIWAGSVGRQGTDDFLWRIEDAGDKLVRLPHKVLRFAGNRGVEVDPKLTADPTGNAFYVLDEGKIFRYDAVTGSESEFRLQLPDELKPSKEAKTEFGPAVIRFGPDGLLYVRARTKFGNNPEAFGANWITCRFDANGKLVPFAKAGVGVPGLGRHAGEQRTDFAVAPDGSLYIAEYSGPKGPYCHVKRYNPDGSPDRSIISEMTRSGGSLAIGPGNELYVAEAVRPAGRTVPGFIGTDPRNHFHMWYGTLARFDPEKGGCFAAQDGDGLDIRAQGRGAGKLTGALWTYYGICPMSTESGCECSQANVDADRFGRIFVPDLCTFSIQVLDNAGNLVYRFGSYGNYDAQGPKSAAPKPEIPFWYPREVTATDDRAIIADVNNRRTIEVRLGFAASRDIAVNP